MPVNFVSFRAEGRGSFGFVTQGGVHDLGQRLGPAIPDLKAYLNAVSLDSERATDGVGIADYTLDEITFDPVIPNPAKILCVGLNYQEHIQETGRASSKYPALFTRFADTLIGHRAAICRPAISTALDYEGELAVIIGRAGFRIPKEQALEHVAGYSCFNDATVRDWQRHTHQFTPGKNFPGTGSLGPFLVTAPLEDFATRKIETRVNGHVMQTATLGDMIFSVAEVIAYISSFTRLSPGDVIATGTPGGIGFTREPQVLLKPGDQIEVIIDGIGHLSNPVRDENLLPR